MSIAPLFGAYEPLSALLHLGGAVVYAALTVSLLHRMRRDPGRHRRGFPSVVVFAVSCIGLLAISGVYHLTPATSAWRQSLQRLDHAAIFVLIAGTFTPFIVLGFRGSLRWAVLGVGWLLAGVAIIVKLFYFDALQGGLGLALYVAVGSVAVFSVLVLPSRGPLLRLAPMAWGAAAYLCGALLELNLPFVLVEGIAGPHELFHGAVLVGSGLHWSFLSEMGTRRPL